MEFTAGGRNKKIATSKGRLPWDMPGPGGGGREAVASRGKAARSGGAPPMLEVTHEEEGMPPQQQSSLSAREPRQGGHMRIDVPPAGCGGAGPLSAPSVSIHGSSGRQRRADAGRQRRLRRQPARQRHGRWGTAGVCELGG